MEVDEGVLDPELGVGAMRLAKRLVEVLAQLGVGRCRVHDLARVHEEARQLEVRVRARRPVGAPLGDARLEGVDELQPVVRRELQAEVPPVQVKGLAALDDEALVEDRLLGQLAFGERENHLAHGLRPPQEGGVRRQAAHHTGDSIAGVVGLGGPVLRLGVGYWLARWPPTEGSDHDREDGGQSEQAHLD